MSAMENEIECVRVLLADDHPVVLEGMAALLESDRRFRIVARCTDGAACLQAIRDLAPDLALIDVAMPGLTGLQILEAVEAERLPVRVAVLTATQDPVDVARAHRAGAWAILLKDATPEELIGTLAEIAAGRRAIPSPLVEAAFASERSQRAGDQADDGLSAREREVMRLIGQGLSNKAIADRLDVAEGTVKNHLHNIYEKLGVKNRTALALLARVRK